MVCAGPCLVSCVLASQHDDAHACTKLPAPQVNTCLRKYQYMEKASRLAEKLQREGKEVPKTMEGMSKAMGAPLE